MNRGQVTGRFQGGVVKLPSCGVGRGGKFEVSIGSLDEPNKTVHAQYRPPELQIDKSIQWVKNQNMAEGQELQLLFTEPEGRVTSLELFFDAVETKNNSVEESINALMYLTNTRIQDLSQADEPWRKRPHHCVLVVGNVYRSEVFKCVIESISTKITMFSPEGTPIRATVNLKVREANSVALSSAGNTQAVASAASTVGGVLRDASGYSSMGPGAIAAAAANRLPSS